MTALVIPFVRAPHVADARADLAAFWAAEVAFARVAIETKGKYSNDELRNFCAVLRSKWGNATDYLRAGEKIDEINRLERDAAHEAARRETSARIALRHLPRWPALLAGAVAFLAVAWVAVALVMGVGG